MPITAMEHKKSIGNFQDIYYKNNSQKMKLAALMHSGEMPIAITKQIERITNDNSVTTNIHFKKSSKSFSSNDAIKTLLTSMVLLSNIRPENNGTLNIKNASPHFNNGNTSTLALNYPRSTDIMEKIQTWQSREVMAEEILRNCGHKLNVSPRVAVLPYSERVNIAKEKYISFDQRPCNYPPDLNEEYAQIKVKIAKTYSELNQYNIINELNSLPSE